MTDRFRLASLMLLLFGAPIAGFAQQPEKAAEPTDPQSVELETADGVLLRGVFFQAENAGPDSPVVVMLPDEGESPAVFDRLAMKLQFGLAGEGHAPVSVLAIALRGQGDSTRVRKPDGEIADLRGARLTPADVAAMVQSDMEAVRRFLVEKNDSRRLNLNRLAYLGSGMGALVAANAAALDWEAPILDRAKQGRDVKALVLVSPNWKQLGLEVLPALRQPGVQKEVAVLVTYGAKLRTAKNDAERIVRQLEKGRPEPPTPETAEGQGDEPADSPTPTIVDLPGDSRLQGAAWLKQFGRQGELAISEFLQTHLVEPDLPWLRRRLN